jgi:transglutaminase-like putative cysteine protease
MRFAVTHETTFRFDGPANRAIQTLRLTPRNLESQLVKRWRIDVSRDCRLQPVEDPWGNLTHTFSVDGPFDELTIAATGVVSTSDVAGVLGNTRERLPLTVFRRQTARTRVEKPVDAFAREATAGTTDALSALHALMGALHEKVAVDAGAAERLPHEVLAAGAATVIDHVHLFAAAARALEIPARLAHGLLLRADEGVVEHAWIEAHVGRNLGWVGFDAIEDRCPTDAYLRIAVGLDAADAAPIRGVFTPAGRETVETRVSLVEIPHL